MPRRFVNSLQDGESIDEVFLLTDRQLRANRNGDTYLLSQLRDRTGQISALLWNVSDSAVGNIRSGDYVQARGKVQLFQGNLQMILTKIEPADSGLIAPEDFIPHTSADTRQQLARLRDILLGVKQTELRALLETFLNDDDLTQQLQQAPAGVRMHHAWHGGLLEHVLTLAESAVRLADLYPKVDFDLVLAGIFLHDLGKLRELAWETSFVYSDEGQLIGHLVIGVEMLNEYIARTEARTNRQFPTELALRLKHMILSHHGSYEYGSPKLPMTLEAVALHQLDNLDAKINESLSLIESDPNSTSTWTPYHTSMQRKLFKGGSTDWSG